MMKRLVIAVCVIILLMTAMAFHVRHLEKLTGELIHELERASACTAAADWSNAKDAAEHVMETWERHSFYLHVTLRHEDIDEIRTSMREMLAYLDSREDRAECMTVAARIINLLELLLEAEQLTVKNVL